MSPGASGARSPVLSVVTPAYQEAANLPVLAERLTCVLAGLGLEWEWIIVDDHSTDETFAVIGELARAEPRIRGLRLARNFGSHAAIACGLEHARGAAAAVLAADLQDPPQVLEALLARWRDGAQVVWAERSGSAHAGAGRRGLSRLYHWLLRRAAGVDVPAAGADCFLLDRVVIEGFRRFSESHGSLLALITWMGFRQDRIGYDKQPRLHGRSGWSLGKKVNLLVDSITAFTYLPIRLMSGLGFVTACLGFVYAAVIVARAMGGHSPQGWSSLMVVVLVVGGIQMLMMGILGEYVWRALGEAQRRPRYLIQAVATAPAGAGAREPR